MIKQVVVVLALVPILAACLPSGADPDFQTCSDGTNVELEGAVACYRQHVESQPLRYVMTAGVKLPDLEQRTYQLTSQSWSPGNAVQPAQWQHDVTILIPNNAVRGRALVIANNGTRQSLNGAGRIMPTDFTPEALAGIAKRTRTVVISVSDVPSQYLTYADDGKARTEDDSVAHTWALFMRAPEQGATMPLHVPMAAVVSRAMTLAERELQMLDIRRFVVSGISKRAWASWLTAIVDPRVDAVVPFAVDLLSMRDGLVHMYRTYGGNWPLAFRPYYLEEVDRRIETKEFSQLIRIEDPLSYLGTRYDSRFEIQKYIVNASGDDFFVPDNASFYYDKLPGAKALRMVPNSSHNGIRNVSVDSLTTFVNRLQNGIALPETNARLDETSSDAAILFQASERPRKLVLWTAENPDARDFRYACGIRYRATPLQLPTTTAIRLPVHLPSSGWAAYFVEATFADGFIATSQAYVLGKEKYPAVAPPATGGACQTLPGRGLRQ